MHSSDDVSLCPGSGIFETFAGNVLFRAIIGKGKKNFLKQSFRAKKKNVLCNNSDQTCFSHTLTSAGPLLRCWNPHLSGSSFNTSLETQQMLIAPKIYYSKFDKDHLSTSYQYFSGNLILKILVHSCLAISRGLMVKVSSIVARQANLCLRAFRHDKL